jgi:hypothetical protein
MTPLDEIKKLYFQTTKSTVKKDLGRAIALFKQLSDEDRDRAAVYMDGLSQMRSEWAAQGRQGKGR